MRFPEHFIETLKERIALSSLVGRSLAWDAKKTQANKGLYWACCPFHGEQTASFKVDDDRGSYHCFGCHASGDHFTWAKEKQGLDFAEAVEMLAREAGLPVPQATPEDAQRARQRESLREANAAAAAWFAAQLVGDRGEAARAYLRGRDIPDTQWTELSFGYAPQSRDDLAQHLRALKFSDEAIIAAGLAREGNTPPFTPVDAFRGRLMIPIRDRQGRVVGFGGRAIEADINPKYLNTGETPLFSKGRLLYNYDRASAEARARNDIVCVEGYLDVAALERLHGPPLWPPVVAPLGTAVTPDQLALLWKAADEPCFCLDGDDAGQKACARVIEAALPLLAPGKSLTFVTLPDKADPDDMARHAPDALRTLLAQRQPLIDRMWLDLAAKAQWETPERRMKFEAAVVAAVARITDESVRKAYELEMAQRLKAFWKAKGVKAAAPRFEKKPAASDAAPSGGGGMPLWTGELCDSMNRHYALVMNGQRAAVLCDSKEEAGGAAEGLRFWAVDGFRTFLANRKAWGGRGPSSQADLWLEDPARREYRGLEFVPGAPGEEVGRKGFYNLWRGHAELPKANPDLAMPWLNHVRENLADGDDKLFEWIVSWFAWPIQFPRRRSGVSLVIRGGMGTGKTVTGKIVGSLYPAHYYLVDDPRYLTGQFNAHMASCLLLHADEGFWAGDKQAEGRLKGLVTSDFQMVEQKGIDPIRVPNFVNLLITSNEDWVVPAGLRERRFAVIDCAPHRMQDTKYFGDLVAHFRKPEAKAALLHALMTWKIDEAFLRKVPSTEALFSQKMRSFDSVVAWLYDLLVEGRFAKAESWPVWVETSEIHQHYLKRCERFGFRHPLSPGGLGRKLKQFMPGISRHQNEQRTWCYVLPVLEDCRREFGRAVDFTVDWASDNGGQTLEAALASIGQTVEGSPKRVKGWKNSDDIPE